MYSIHIFYIANVLCTIASSVATTIGISLHQSTLDKIKGRLKVIYDPSPAADEQHCYIQLALVKDSAINRNHEKLNEITKLTLQGQVDEITQMKESLNGIRDMFCYKNTICPRVILIIGAPGTEQGVRTYIYICSYVFAYMHMYIQMYIRIYIHTYIRTYMHACIHTYIHIYVHTYVRTYVHTYTHICVHIYV